MLNRKAIQRELDLAAEELDRQGYKDLADKVDLYNTKLQRASSREIPLIRKALINVQEEADRRANRKDNPRTSSLNKEAELAKRRALLERWKARRAHETGLEARREAMRREKLRKVLAERRAERNASLRSRRESRLNPRASRNVRAERDVELNEYKEFLNWKHSHK